MNKYINKNNDYNAERNQYLKNIAEATIAVEDKIRLGYNDAIIANSRDHVLNGGEYIDYSFDDAESWANGVANATLNAAAFGTFNAASAGNTIHYTYDKSTNRITMHCKYYFS